jgi:endonuclease/exonuclease/phosphatase family metal-dependent hydrolase
MHAAFAAPSLPPPPRPPDRPDQAGLEVGVAVLSRWPILQVEQHRLPSRHRCEIVALAVRLDHPRGPLHVVACCIDWEPEFAAQRLAQTRALAALLTDPSRDGPLPVLLTTDLNAPPTTPEIQVLTEVMVDAWVAANGAADPGHTLSTSNPWLPGKHGT